MARFIARFFMIALNLAFVMGVLHRIAKNDDRLVLGAGHAGSASTGITEHPPCVYPKKPTVIH
jgi:hypothetical protein